MQKGMETIYYNGVIWGLGFKVAFIWRYIGFGGLGFRVKGGDIAYIGFVIVTHQIPDLFERVQLMLMMLIG